jgi:sulfotransferase
LANILLQNPRVHATHTSGLLDTLSDMRNAWDALHLHRARPMPEAKREVMRSVMFAYHERDRGGRPVVIDRVRGWPAYIEMVEYLLGEKAKILLCYRDIADVLASFEKLRRRTVAEQRAPDEANFFYEYQTQEGRCNVWMLPTNATGLARNRVMDCIQRGLRDRLYPVYYPQLCAEPDQVMRGVYAFLDEPYFRHDFTHVEQVTREDDTVHGYLGLHTIRTRVEYRDSDAAQVLGRELVARYSALNLKF